MAKPTDYSALVADAEKAVQAVKDPELKRIAFQKVLDDLLSGGSGGGGDRKEPTRRKSKRSKGPSAHRAPKSAASGPRAYIRELHGDGFFKKPKTITDVKVELENRGHHIPMTSLSGPLQALCKEKLLRRQRTGTEGKGKKTFAYSNW
jgi:membrane protein involved in colicin uptake